MLKKIVHRLLTRSSLGRILPDRIYLWLIYRIRVGERLNLQNPQSFTEKIQWLKLNWRDPLMTQCADKFTVRKFVGERTGPQLLKALYGVYESPDDIDFSTLPDTFVLKLNHGCQQNIFCKNKSEVDRKKTIRLLKRYLKENYYGYFREWAYKEIPPRIICEEHLTRNGETLYEYGFYCYDGVPRVVEINEYAPGLKRVNMFDLNLNLLENRYRDTPLITPVRKTPEYEKMLEYAALLSRGFPFVRVDLIQVHDRIVFGEMTFYPLAGLSRLNPTSFDSYLGSFLNLPVLPFRAA